MAELHTEIARHFNERAHIAHGLDHVERVAALARFIAEKESYNPEEAEIAGLLHDIGRTVQEEEKGHGPAGVPLASELLDKHTTFDHDAKQRILNAVRDHSDFKPEGKLTHILQDADMLDGLGAIGIMRGYTSKASLPCYDPEDIVPQVGERNTTIHGQLAFQMEWLGMMHTDTGKTIAARRHALMQDFLQNFKFEVLGQDYRNELGDH
ncbi:HD domain-containing protein [soil metagenome]